MKTQIGFLCIVALGGICQASAGKMGVTPVNKVVALLEGMLERGKKEKHAEQVAFAATKTWCDSTAASKVNAIANQEETIGTLGADIQKYTSVAARLTKEVAGLDEDVSIWSGDIKAARNVRAIEKGDYDKTHAGYTESIQAIGNAIAVLKKENKDRKQADSFLQISSLKKLNLMPDDAKKMIDAFLQGDHAFLQQASLQEEAETQTFQTFQSERSELLGAPEANAYEFQSQGVIDMLDQLGGKFLKERETLEKEEKNAKHAFQMMVQDLEAQIAQGAKEREKKSGNKAKTLEHKADATGDLKVTQKINKADVAYLDDLKANCAQKASDFETRQQLRADEIEAIETAIGIISGDSVKGNSDKHGASFLQKSSSFGQLRSTTSSQLQSRVAQFLHRRSESLNSAVLAVVARRAASDPFTKVKKMIKDLIVRLMEEANEESEHKGWCDTELASNEQTRKEKSDSIETLHADIDQLESQLAKLQEDVGDLSGAVAELDGAMAEATKLRTTVKAENEETIQDAKEAQQAIAQALTVLNQFYEKAAGAFLQEDPTMQAESKGVVGLLEVIESDFARLESETQAAEATAQKEYDNFMQISKIDKAEKLNDGDGKGNKKQDKAQVLLEKKNDLEGNQKELNAAIEYFEKLRPSCVDSSVSYEDRVARRKEEIESLQGSLKILNGEDIA